jgi:hypothetical protein
MLILLKCSAGPNTSPTLQYAKLSLVPNDKCNESYVNNRRVNIGVQDSILCASDTEGEMDTCHVSWLSYLLLTVWTNVDHTTVSHTQLGPYF